MIVRITDDELGIGPEGSPILFIALGGPDDPIEVRNGGRVFEMTREDVDQFQVALLNFMNTGFFNEEG
jgi:hypothetical protein